MRAFAALSLAIPFGLLAFAASCGDDETTAPAAVPDAAQPDVGKGTTDTGAPVIDDGGLTSDAQPDAADAGDSGDAGSTIALYSIIDSKLVTLDPVTGAVVEVGPIGQTFAPLVWDVKANVARIIKDPQTAPTLGTVNLCTGTITPGTRMTVSGGGNLDQAEGFTQDPASGTFYASVDLDNSAFTVTEATATVNIATGAITSIGTHTTLQNDGDVLAWFGTSLHLLDIDTTGGKSAYYTINTANGAAALVKEIAASKLLFRFAEDKSRGKIFATYGTSAFQNRGLATLDLASGTLTDVGTPLSDATYAGQHFQTLMVAPKPTCP